MHIYPNREYRRALRVFLDHKVMWPAAVMASLSLTETWRIVAGWGPEYLAERWRAAAGGEAEGVVFFLFAFVSSFLLLRGLGYLAEIIMVRQAADAGPSLPGAARAFRETYRRYPGFSACLLPWDAAFTMVLYLPGVLGLCWREWDPAYRFFWLYVLLLLLWAVLLSVVVFPFYVVASLAARRYLLGGAGFLESWKKACRSLRNHPGRCLTFFCWELAAEVLFLVVAWPAASLIPWVLRLCLGNPPSTWAALSLYRLALACLSVGLIVFQAGVQGYRSTLYTLLYLGLERREMLEFRGVSTQYGD